MRFFGAFIYLKFSIIGISILVDFAVVIGEIFDMFSKIWVYVDLGGA